jgi:4-hydroxy-tetrahydrodipicolinate reductase
MIEMKIAIIGYGKMGKMIETTAKKRGHTIGSTIDLGDEDLMAQDNLDQHDVAIEFTSPSTAFDNISKCMDAGLPVVSGSTGWTDRIGELQKRCETEHLGFVYGSNFSLGVNILFSLNERLASIMQNYEAYDVSMTEIHHTQKLDAPSGTALTLAEGIMENISRKKQWVLQDNARDDDLWINAIRTGNVTGVHEVTYESVYDSISIKHSAKDRSGFATGAVLAAEFIKDRKGFFTMKDVLQL